jgi:hypothetical protein
VLHVMLSGDPGEISQALRSLRDQSVEHGPTRKLSAVRVEASQKERPHLQREAKPSVQNLWSPVCRAV